MNRWIAHQISRDAAMTDLFAEMAMQRNRLTIFFDGGCHPNPGMMETAVVTRGEALFQHDLGIGDNNVAEWLALRHAVELAVLVGADDVLLVGDSVMVVQQALGRWCCRDERLQVHRDAFLKASSNIARLHVKQVRRSKNLAGVELDRQRDGRR